MILKTRLKRDLNRLLPFNLGNHCKFISDTSIDNLNPIYSKYGISTKRMAGIPIGGMSAIDLLGENFEQITRTFKYVAPPHLMACRNVILIAKFKFSPKYKSLIASYYGYITVSTPPDLGLFISENGQWQLMPLIPELFESIKPAERQSKGMVKTLHGKIVPKDKCTKLFHCWFTTDELVEIEDKLYPNVDNTFVKDYRTDKYIFQKEACSLLKSSILGCTTSSSIRKNTGYTKLTIAESRKLINVECMGGRYTVLDRKTALELDCVEDAYAGVWYCGVPVESFSDRPREKYEQFDHTHSKIILTKTATSAQKQAVNEFNYRNGTDSRTNIMCGLPYSFGVEIETSAGTVPQNIVIDEMNVRAVRDGSTSGAEYVTGVLKGDSGFLQVKKLCKELTKRSHTDRRCGLHVHIGGVAFNKEFTVYMYILGLLIEKSLFSILPHSRRNNLYCSMLNSDILDPKSLRLFANATELPKEMYSEVISELFSNIFETMSGEKPTKGLNRKKPHPRGHYAGSATGGSARYNWLNMVTANFAQKEVRKLPNEIWLENLLKDLSRVYIPGVSSKYTSELVGISKPNRHMMFSSDPTELQGMYTVEFRNHSSTTNYFKVRNWILICMALVAYVESHKSTILESLRTRKLLLLEDILQTVYGTRAPKTVKTLINYVQKRRSKFSVDCDEEIISMTSNIVDERESTLTIVKELKCV